MFPLLQEAEAKAAEEEKKKAIEAMYQAARDYGKNKAEGGCGSGATGAHEHHGKVG